MTRKRFIWIFVCALLVALIGFAALYGSNVVANPIETGPQAAWLYLNARALGKLDAAWDDATGVPTFISSSDANARIPYAPKANERNNPELIARGFLAENAALFKLGVNDSFTLRRVESDAQLHYASVRLDQTYKNIPVDGQEVIVHVDPQGSIVAVNGHFVPNLNVMTEPIVTKQDAAQIALDDLLNNQLQSNERARVKTNVLDNKTQLVIYLEDGNENHATLTWSVTIMTTSPLGQWRYYINARRPTVTALYDSAEHIKQRETYTADNDTDIPGRILINEGERSTRDPIAQAAHDGAGKVYDYYFNTFKRDGVDGQGGTLVSTVHYGNDPSDAENAAWIGENQQMIYGDGGKIFKPLPYGLDVIGHEFTHGVTGATADLEYKAQSGALNESYSDVFGAMIDRGNWTIGETVIKSPPFPRPFLRSLQDPNMNGAYDRNDPLGDVGQPANVSEYARLPVSRKGDNGGVHINSGIPNRAAFLIGQQIGPDKLEQIYYRTLTQYLTPTSQFADAATASLRAAQDLYGNGAEVQAVRAGFSGVGINVSGGSNVPTPPTPTSPSNNNAPPPPSNTTPQGCTNLIVNGTFETDEAWQDISGQQSQLIDTELPHTGKRSAWLGGQDKEPVQTIFQDVSIPANATRVQLAYFRYLHAETSGLSGLFSSDAQFGAVVADTKGNVIGAFEKLVSSQADDTWQSKQFDASQLAGKTVRLAFTSDNPRGNVSSMFVDDVSLIVCTTGNAPSAPQAPANSVFLQGNVVDADTKRGIEGAQVFVMRPGLSATQAAADDQVTRSEIIAQAVSDGNGFYQTDVALPVGRAYSVIVIASGYRPIVADDGINLPANAENPYDVDATLRKSR